jgi:HD-like signal output (HDOD) protein
MHTLTPEQRMRREKTELVLTKILNIPPIPNIMTEVIKLIDSKKATSFELNKIISRDQGLVTKILTIANSPLYGLQRKVTTLDFAILILGYSELRNIVSTLAMIESFKNKTDKYLDQKEFWLHSYLTGSAAKRLAEDLGLANSGEAFIAGFLHDVGISVLHRYFHTNFITICENVEKDGKSYCQAELDLLGMTHGEIGNTLLEKWNFPHELCDAILAHENPSMGKYTPFLPSIVHLADYMTKHLRVGFFEWDKDLQFEEEAMKTLRFPNMEKVEEFINGYQNLFVTQSETVRFLS